MEKAIMFIQSEISNALLCAGLQANLQGFDYLCESIMEGLKHPNLLQSLTKELYPMIGERHQQTAAVIERSMRHVIEVAYRSRALYGLNQLFDKPVLTTNFKPCNGCFIGLVCVMVKKNLLKIVANSSDKDLADETQLAHEIQEFLKKYYSNDTIPD